MVVVTDFTYKNKNGELRRGFYLDGGLKKVLDQIYNGVMKKSNNCVIIFDGDLGTAKSWGAVKVGYYWRWLSGKELSITHIVFTLEQFLELLPKLKKGDVVIFDEAIFTASSRDAMTQQNKKLMKIMMTMRSRQVFFIFCLPSFFDLDRTLALHRADMLIHMKSSYFGQRGDFSCYFKPKLKRLFIEGKKYYNYPVKADLIGHFTKIFPLIQGYDAYETKKQAAVNQFAAEPLSPTGNKWLNQRNNMIVYLKEKQNMKFTEIAKLIGEAKGDSVSKQYRRIKTRERMKAMRERAAKTD